MTDELDKILNNLVGAPKHRKAGAIIDAKQAIQALIDRECNRAKMEQLKYMEQFAQKQDIDWDFIANMIGQLELSNKENK